MAALKALIPQFGDAAVDLEDQVRSVLHLLVDLGASDVPSAAAVADFHLCPNCGGVTGSLSSPYCSQTCRDQAAFVRQFRGALASGSLLTAEKQVVYGERLWWLLGGGLPLREVRIPESARRQVTTRSGGKCESCGAPMTAIENHGSGCNRPLHLRAVCAACSTTRRYGDVEFSQSSSVVRLLAELSTRITAQTPLRPCDDPDTWDWRAYVAQRAK